MRFDVITLLPELVEAVVKSGVVGRAEKKNLIDLKCWNPRDFAQDVHRTVDDRPYGGGPGMVMKPDCLFETIRAVKVESSESTKVVYLSPQGKPFNQSVAREMLTHNNLILLCGRYEGIDQRIIDLEVDEEWSLGDYVLSGGELGAMVVIDAITRLIPTVLGHKDSAVQDSFTENLLDCDHYTRPEIFEDLKVPAVLKSGDHQEIARWRRKQSLGKTFNLRPDLLILESLSNEDKQLLNEYLKEHSLS